MFKYLNFIILSIIVILLSILASINQYSYSHPKPVFFIDMQKNGYNFNTKSLKYFSLGQQRMLVALLWVQTLVNLDLKHYKKKDLNSWPYLRFDLMAILDNKFYENYLFGAQYLSVVKDDLLGAEDLYIRGLKVYPDDYHLNFAAGYHFYFELNKIKESIYFFKAALKSPKAPTYLPSLIARLETQRNNPQIAFDFLLTIYKKTPKASPVYKYYHQRLYDLKAFMDLKCLNNRNKNCSPKDFSGNYYVLKGKSFVSIKKRLPIRVFKSKKN